MNRRLVIAICAVLAVLLLGFVAFLWVGPGLLEADKAWARGVGLYALRCRVGLGTAGPGFLREAIGAAHQGGDEDQRAAQIDELVLAGYGKLGPSDKEQFLRGLERDILESWDLSLEDYFSLVYRMPTKFAGGTYVSPGSFEGFLTPLWPSLSLDFLKEGMASNDPGVRALARVIAESRTDTLPVEDKKALVTHAFDAGMARRDRQIVDDAMATAANLGVHLDEVWEARRHELEGPSAAP